MSKSSYRKHCTRPPQPKGRGAPRHCKANESPATDPDVPSAPRTPEEGAPRCASRIITGTGAGGPKWRLYVACESPPLVLCDISVLVAAAATHRSRHPTESCHCCEATEYVASPLPPASPVVMLMVMFPMYATDMVGSLSHPKSAPVTPRDHEPPVAQKVASGAASPPTSNLLSVDGEDLAADSDCLSWGTRAPVYVSPARIGPGPDNNIWEKARLEPLLGAKAVNCLCEPFAYCTATDCTELVMSAL